MPPVFFVVSKLKMTNQEEKKEESSSCPVFFSFASYLVSNVRLFTAVIFFFLSNSLLTVVSSLIQLVRVSLLSFTLDTLLPSTIRISSRPVSLSQSIFLFAAFYSID